ncbi:unnamed protein product, partial [Ixodes pacificus]
SCRVQPGQRGHPRRLQTARRAECVARPRDSRPPSFSLQCRIGSRNGVADRGAMRAVSLLEVGCRLRRGYSGPGCELPKNMSLRGPPLPLPSKRRGSEREKDRHPRFRARLPANRREFLTACGT